MDKKIFEQMYKEHILYLTGEHNGDPLTTGNFSGLDFTGMTLDGLNISNADFTNADFTDTSMRCCIFHDCNFNGARFRNANTTCSEFNRSTFHHGTIRSAIMVACSFDSCVFERTFAENSDFSRSVFANAFFEGNLFNCDNFTGTILADTLFNGATTQFRHCDFSGWNSKNLKGLDFINLTKCIFKDNKPTNSLRHLNPKEFVKYTVNRIMYNIKSLLYNGKRVAPPAIGITKTKMIGPK